MLGKQQPLRAPMVGQAGRPQRGPSEVIPSTESGSMAEASRTAIGAGFPGEQAKNDQTNERKVGRTSEDQPKRHNVRSAHRSVGVDVYLYV